MAGMMYIMMQSPFVGFNDGLSFLLEAENGFSWHTNATSHFLYNNLQHILVSVLGFLPPVRVMVFFSIICSLLSLVRIYQIGRIYVGPLQVLPIPAMVLGLSFTFWQQSEIIEVYAFSNFLFLTLLYFSLKDIVAKEPRHLFLVATVMGLCILTHIQHILALPFFIYYLYRARGLGALKVAGAVALFAALASILFIVPLATGNHSISAIFFDNQFKDEVLALNMELVMTGMGKGMMFLMYNFHMFLIFIFHGWYVMWRDRRDLFWQLLIVLIPYLIFATKYSVSDNHVFFLVPYLILLGPMALSLMNLAFKLMPYMNWMVPMMMMMSPMMYMGATMMAKDHPRFAEYQIEKAYKGGVKHLLWPGKRDAKDPLAAAKAIYQANPGTDPATIEWNYETAVKYLRFKGEL